MPRYSLSLEVDPLKAMLTIAELSAKHGWSMRIESSRGVSYRLPSNAFAGTFDDISKAEASMNALIGAATRAYGVPVSIKKFLLAEYAKVKFASDDQKPALKADSPRAAAQPKRAQTTRK